MLQRLKNESFSKTILPYNASLQFRDPVYSCSQGAISYLEKRRFDTTPFDWCKLELFPVANAQELQKVDDELKKQL